MTARWALDKATDIVTDLGLHRMQGVESDALIKAIEWALLECERDTRHRCAEVTVGDWEMHNRIMNAYVPQEDGR